MNLKPKISRAVALPQGELNWTDRVREYAEFFAAWVRRPRQTASVVPSSRFLARLMVRDIDPAGGRVLELGGGTGVFTRAILGKGLPAARLEVVEINSMFARGLERQFPGVDVIQHRAESISAYVSGTPGGYQAVVSGLPLLAINQETQREILREAFSLLAPDGVFVQFTYSMLPPVSGELLQSLGLVATRAGMTVRNFPPATVFHFRRASTTALPGA